MTDEQLRKQREYRLRNGNLSTKKYEKTKKGFLMRVYRNMESRITGIQYKKAHLYKDKELLNREDFYNFSINNPTFHILFNIWENSQYSRKLSPSIDRIDSTLGYNLDNMRWITHSENSKLGAISRHSQNN